MIVSTLDFLLSCATRLFDLTLLEFNMLRWRFINIPGFFGFGKVDHWGRPRPYVCTDKWVLKTTSLTEYSSPENLAIYHTSEWEVPRYKSTPSPWPSSSAIPTTSGSMNFFAFPAELRLQIYEKILISGQPIEITPYYAVDDMAAGNVANIAVEGLVVDMDHPMYALCHRVSQWMRAETAVVYLGNHFYFAGCWYFVNAVRSIEPDLTEHIREVTINWTAEGASEAVAELRKLVNLVVLRIRVEVFLKEDFPEDLSEMRGIKEVKKFVGELSRLKNVMVEWDDDDEGFLSDGEVKRLEALRAFMGHCHGGYVLQL